MSDAKKPLIGITMGDPAGVGPELCLKAAIDPAVGEICGPVIYGDSMVMEKVRKACCPEITFTQIAHGQTRSM